MSKEKTTQLINAKNHSTSKFLFQFAVLRDPIQNTSKLTQSNQEQHEKEDPASKTLNQENDTKPLPPIKRVSVKVADLMEVQTTPQGYLPSGEVDLVTNVMKTEKTERATFHTEETEQTYYISDAVTSESKESQTAKKSSENSSSSSTHHQLQNAVKKTISDQEDTSLEASISGSYGKILSGSAGAKYRKTHSSTKEQSSSEVSEETSNIAKKYATEVTESAEKKVSESVTKTATVRKLEKTQNEYRHVFDNAGGKEHVVGIYEKYNFYQKATLWNYGKCLMLEGIIQDPSAMYLRLIEQQIKKPKEPPLPSELTETNYRDYLDKYGVKDIEGCRYPEPLEIPVAFTEAALQKTIEKAIPPGYACKKITGGFLAEHSNIHGAINGRIFTSLHTTIELDFSQLKSGKVYGIDENKDNSNEIDYSLLPTDTISITFRYMPNPSGDKTNSVNVSCNLTAHCILTKKAKNDWQHKVHSKIQEGYKKQEAKYKERLNTLQQTPKSDEEVFQIIRDELQRGTLLLLTDNFRNISVNGKSVKDKEEVMFNAMQFNDGSLPKLNTEKSCTEGKIINFFQNGFEWSDMTYRLYPYLYSHWNDSKAWVNNYSRDDNNPKFKQFLRAGSAKVVVPINPEYTIHVLHYLFTNDILTNLDKMSLPLTNPNPLYLALLNEVNQNNSSKEGNTNYNASNNKEDQHPSLSLAKKINMWTISMPSEHVVLSEKKALPEVNSSFVIC